MVASDTIGAGVRLERVSGVEGGAVRHFDQLSHREQRCFLRLRRGENPSASPLSVGEVIVFTGYYRVVERDG